MSYDSDDSASVDTTPKRPQGLVIETTPGIDIRRAEEEVEYISPGNDGVRGIELFS
jgi:hypothetical protein